MRARWRQAAIGAIVLLFGLVALGVWWAGRLPEREKKPGLPVQGPRASAQARPLFRTGPVRLRGADEKGNKLWEAMLERVEISGDQSRATFQNLGEATIFDKAGQEAVRLTAKQFRYSLNNKNFEVIGDVRVISKRGIAFKTQRVKWVSATRDLVCPEPVVAIHKNAVIRTAKLTFHTATDRVECPTKVSITTPSTQAVADRAEIDLKAQTVHMIGLRGTIVDPEAAKKEFDVAKQGA